MMKEISDKLRLESEPHKIGNSKKILLLVMVFLYAMQIMDFFYKLEEASMITTLLIYSTYLHYRTSLMLDVRFYNRKLELISK